jgi:hypothetical protein
MALNDRDRDELLIDLLESMSHVISLLEFKNKLSSRVVHDKATLYREKLNRDIDNDGFKTVPSDNVPSDNVPSDIPPPPKLPKNLDITKSDIEKGIENIDLERRQ